MLNYDQVLKINLTSGKNWSDLSTYSACTTDLQTRGMGLRQAGPAGNLGGAGTYGCADSYDDQDVKIRGGTEETYVHSSILNDVVSI